MSGPDIFAMYFCICMLLQVHSFVGSVKYPHGQGCVARPNDRIQFLHRSVGRAQMPFQTFGQKTTDRAYPVSLDTLGDHIRKKRLDLRLRQKEVARVLGVDTMTVNNWEGNRCKPKLYLIPKIVQFLGTSPFPTYETPSIIEAIRAYRLTHGLSQKKLAKVLSIDPTTLARWEKGRGRPGKELRKRLAESSDISVNGVLQKTPTAAGRDSLSAQS